MLDAAETARLTAAWYAHFYRGKNNGVLDFTRGQLAEYTALAARPRCGVDIDVAMSAPGMERVEPALPEGVRLSPLRRIDTPAGPVLHALKASEPAFQGFGEAYFTAVGRGQVKAWKRHRRMVSNLVVPVGEVRSAVAG